MSQPRRASLKADYIKVVMRSHASCLEGHGQRLVAPPVGRQHGAQEIGAVGPDQLPGVVRQHVHHVAGVRPGPEGPRGGHGPGAVSDLTAGEGRGGRREPSGGGRLYGNMHHNSRGSVPPDGGRSGKDDGGVGWGVSPPDEGVPKDGGWRRRESKL